jgi:hypothetical protein
MNDGEACFPIQVHFFLALILIAAELFLLFSARKSAERVPVKEKPFKNK